MKKVFLILTLLLLASPAFAADQAITDFTADASPTSDDLVVTVNDPSGTPANRKVTISNVFAAMSSQNLSDAANVGRLDQAETIAADWVNTANPWADNEVADTITLTNITQITNRAITDTTANNWKVFYSNGSGVLTELSLGASGTVLQSNGASSAPTFETPAGSSPLTDSGTTTYLTTTTDDFALGATQPVSSAKFTVDGDDDQIQALIQGNGTQTSTVFLVEKSDGTDLFKVDNDGTITMGDTGSNPGFIIPEGTAPTTGAAEGGLYVDTNNTLKYVEESDGTDHVVMGFNWVMSPQNAKLPTSNWMQIESGGNRWSGLFDDTTSKSATWETTLYPYQGGTLQGKILYNTTATSGTAAFDISIDCIGDSDADPDTESFGTADTLSATVDATGSDLDVLSDTSLNGDTCQEFDLMVVKVSRNVGTDTVTGDLKLRKVVIFEQ